MPLKSLMTAKRVEEEALRLKEKHGGEVAVASIGRVKNAAETLAALALGAVHLKHEGALARVIVSTLLAEVCEAEKPDLVILGKQSTDGDHDQAGRYLAARLGWPQATFASKNESLASV